MEISKHQSCPSKRRFAAGDCTRRHNTSRSNVDPQLGRFIIPDGCLGYFLLSSNSPAIDTGDPNNFPSTDLLGIVRPFGLRPDIGAVESVPLSSITLASTGAVLTFSIQTGLGHASTVEASNDLRHWEAVYSAPPSSQYRYQPDRTSPHRFYRVRESTQTTP